MIPSRYIIRCPACGLGIEAPICAWNIGLVSAEEGEGILLQIQAFVGHVCEEPTGDA